MLRTKLHYILDLIPPGVSNSLHIPMRMKNHQI
jgi:hypothetical protein